MLPNWLAAMRRGDFEAAWQQTDRVEGPRRSAEARGILRHQPHHLVWNGSAFEERVVLVRCEHGLGDTLQFVRYLSPLRQRARRVILKVQPALLDLLEGVAGADQVINAWMDKPDPSHDVSVECMEFSYAFRDTLDSIPSRVPYLPVERIMAREHCRIAPSQNFNIGLFWAASNWDDTRSVPVAEFLPFAAASNVTFHSLQQGDRQNDALYAPFPLIPLSDQTANIADAAAAMLQLDLIITVDSMIAHLAGALGCPVWVLLKHDPDWRWMHARSDSPWYPSMRLFRQSRPGDWSSVIGAVANALRLDRPAARGAGS